MIKSAKHSLLLAALLGLSVSALAQTKGIDRTGDRGALRHRPARPNVVKSGFGLCWRTGYWTPAMAESVRNGQYPDLAANATRT
jgi:OOP family OmpA-OmpF porin